MLCHEVNRAYCESMGDSTQVAWDEAPEWQKESAMMGVELHANDHDAGPQASHESWMAQKVADGWVYGEVKDPDKKEHPCIVAFSELPPEQQAKDFIFRGVVLAAMSILSDEPAQTVVVTEKVPVKYVGSRKAYSDGLFETGDWLQGQTKMVEVATAKKMLAHPDVYGQGEESESTGIVDKEDDPDRDDAPHLNEARQAIMAMPDKKSIFEFVANNFGGSTLDLPKNATVDKARAEAIRMIDKYHLPE